MKGKKSRMWLSAVLVICMVFGMSGTAFAGDYGQHGSGTVKYVSIGDSMTNGYCFDGYRQGEKDGSLDFINGKGVYGAGAYPLQFEAYLTGLGYDVDHTKLAPSAMRAEDLNYLLGGREKPTDGWEGQVNGYTECSDEELIPFFQKSVAEADVMTVGIGNASFGAYMLHRVTDALGVFGASLEGDEIVDLEKALAELDPEAKKVVLEVYNTMMAELISKVPAEMVEKYNLKQVTDVVAYTAAGYLLNYEGAMDRIVALNPDAEVILVGLMNTTYGMKITMEDGFSIPVGDIMDNVFGALNAYAAGLPAVKQASGEWTDATFYYAEQPQPKFISQKFAELKEKGWENIQNGRLSGTTVRERNITAYNDTLREMIAAAFSNDEFKLSLPEISINDVKGYEANPPKWTNADFGYGFTGEGNDAKNLSIAIYLGIEDAVAESTDTLEIPLSGLMTIAGDLSSVFEDLNIDVTDKNVTPEKMHEGLAAYLTKDEVMIGMCKVYALFKVGNGMSVHPTPEGHDEIAKAVIEAYEGDYTVDKAVVDKATAALAALMDALQQYGPDVADAIYQYAEDQGYIDQLNIALGELDAAVQEQIAYVDTEVVPVINEQVTQAEIALNEAYAQLQAQVAQVQAVIDQLDAERVALEAELAEAYAQLADLNAQLEAAAEEAKPEIQAAIDETNAVIAGIAEAILDIELVQDALNDSVAVLEEKMGEVQEVMKQLKENAEAIGAELYALGEAAAAAGHAAEELAAALAAGSEEGIKEAYAELTGAYNELAEKVSEIDILSDVIDTLVTESENMTGILGSTLDELQGVAEDTYNTFVEELQKLAAEGFAYAAEALTALQTEGLAALDELKQIAQATGTELMAVLQEKLAVIDGEIAGLIDQVETAFNAAYRGAVTGEFTVNCDSYLVSIGDASALNMEGGDSYTKQLAAALAAEAGLAEISYTELGEAGLMAEDLMNVVLTNASEIADADLVAVSVDNNDFIFDRISRMMSGYPLEEIEWSKYVTAEGVPYVEEVLSEIHNYFAEAGLGEYMGLDLADVAAEAVASFAYSYLDYAWNYAQVLTAVHEINPEAQVILVGGFNPMDELVVEGIDIGKIVEGLVDLSDLYGLVYAMLVPNTTYVDVPEVQTIMEASGAVPSPVAYIMAALNGTLAASTDGHTYIKNQILNALTRELKPHVWTEISNVPGADCQTLGVITYECDLCYDTKKEPGVAGPHVAGEWVVTKAATANEAGEKELRCVYYASCNGVIETQTIPATGGGGGGYFPGYGGGAVPSVKVEKPTIEASEGVKVELSADGTKATITVEDGYILMDVVLNGESLGTDITEVTGLKTGDLLQVNALSEADFAKYVKDTQLVARSKMSKAKGKDAVKVYWYEKSDEEKIYDLDFDGYQVYRSVKRYSGFGKKPIFTTERTKYWNTAIEEGTKYYYKVRGYVEVEGKKYYTDWSLKAWRTVKL